MLNDDIVLHFIATREELGRTSKNGTGSTSCCSLDEKEFTSLTSSLSSVEGRNVLQMISATCRF